MSTNYDLAVVINSTTALFACELGMISFRSDHANFDQATEKALNLIDDAIVSEEQWEELLELHKLNKALTKWSNGRLLIEGNRVRFDGDLVPQSLETHLLNLYKSGNDTSLSVWTKFITKLREVSHIDTHNRLHEFLKHNSLTINEEGNVLAWKVVRPDFKDKYSGTMDNSVGKLVEMPRVKVNHNPNQTCSTGLHACAFNYLNFFGNRGDNVLLVEVDVRDIISVPIDYNGEKVRCCKYKVVHHVGVVGETFKGDEDPMDLISQALEAMETANGISD